MKSDFKFYIHRSNSFNGWNTLLFVTRHGVFYIFMSYNPKLQTSILTSKVNKIADISLYAKDVPSFMKYTFTAPYLI